MAIKTIITKYGISTIEIETPAEQVIVDKKINNNLNETIELLKELKLITDIDIPEKYKK